ncbi:hypothetical protein, partial [Paraburkholderia sp. SIMBA_053]|uniref:hypothetical protein n=1 Tax=Paraburkholderia sp. SIMBA_053 TaxID=3085794 RepID=UPI00397C68F8
DFVITKLEPISISKSKIERYIATFFVGIQRKFKRSSCPCRELLTYESFPKRRKKNDGRENECGKCWSERCRMNLAKVLK